MSKHTTHHSKGKHHHASKLVHLTHAEAQAVSHMFSLYDYKSTGRIPPHLAMKLLSQLGLDEAQLELVVFTNEVSLSEVLMHLDQLMPSPEPMLNSSLTTFIGLVSKPTYIEEEPTRVITPQDISDYMESLGRPPAAIKEVNLMLNSMLEYDDCSVDPVLNVERFTNEILTFQRKNNALKEFR